MADLLLDLYGHDPYPQSRSIFRRLIFREAVVCLDSSLLGQIRGSTCQMRLLPGFPGKNPAFSIAALHTQ